MKEQIKQYVTEHNQFTNLDPLQLSSMVHHRINLIHGLELETAEVISLSMAGMLAEQLPIPDDPYDLLRERLNGSHSFRPGLNQTLVGICNRFVDDNCWQSSSSITSDLLIELVSEQAFQSLTPTKDLL